jgi:hypothetical protein
MTHDELDAFLRAQIPELPPADASPQTGSIVYHTYNAQTMQYFALATARAVHRATVAARPEADAARAAAKVSDAFETWADALNYIPESATWIEQRQAFNAGWVKGKLAQPVAPSQEPVAHICILPTKDAGPTQFFTSPKDSRGFPVFRGPQARGMAVVPWEPTDDMWAAADEYRARNDPTYEGFDAVVRGMLRAMLAAASKGSAT